MEMFFPSQKYSASITAQVLWKSDTNSGGAKGAIIWKQKNILRHFLVVAPAKEKKTQHFFF